MTWLYDVLALVAVIAVAVTAAYLLPWLKEKLGAAKFDQLWNLVCIAVQAAEQLFPAPGSGVQKLTYVLKWLKDQGVQTDDGMTRPMIEAAVRELT